MEVEKNVWRINREKFLKDFSDLVLKGIYKKVSYNAWRNLTNSKSEYLTIVKVDKLFTLYTDKQEKPCAYAIGDRSLGDYIYYHWQSSYRELEKLAELSFNWVVDRDKLLDAFTERIQAGVYERVDYSEWGKIAHNDTKYFIVKKTFHPHGDSFAFFGEFSANPTGVIDWDSPIAVFPSTDKSFGRFLSHAWKGKAFSLELPFGLGEEVMNNNWNKDNIKQEIIYNTATTGTSYYASGEPTIVKPGEALNFATTINPYYAITDTLGSVNINYDDIADKVISKINKKEKENMKTNDLFNFEFGPVSSNQFRMSPYGIAVATASNGWVSYNAKTGEIFDVDIINFDVSKMIFKMPVALNAIAVGDILIHSGKPVFVRAINPDTVSVVNYADATVSEILPVKSPFGFNFFTKICALIDFNGTAASESNPFGNMLPFLMLAGNKDSEFDPAMLMMANAIGSTNGTTSLFQNPMMMYLMLSGKDKDKSDMLPFLLMMSMGGGGLVGITSAPTQIETAAPANPIGFDKENPAR